MIDIQREIENLLRKHPDPRKSMEWQSLKQDCLEKTAHQLMG